MSDVADDDQEYGDADEDRASLADAEFDDAEHADEFDEEDSTEVELEAVPELVGPGVPLVADDDDLTEDEWRDRNRQTIRSARRVGGVPGAMVAGAMIALRDIYETPKNDRPVAEVESPGEPHDLERDGVTLGSDDIGGVADVAVEPQPRREPIVGGRRRSRRR